MKTANGGQMVEDASLTIIIKLAQIELVLRFSHSQKQPQRQAVDAVWTCSSFRGAAESSCNV